MQYGTLYLLPVSLGAVPKERYQPPFNIEILQQIDTFVVENARTARHYIKEVLPEKKISVLTIHEIDKHNSYSFDTEVIDTLLAGKDVGLMSEAGCPAVADPGYQVVEQAHRKGIRVVPLVGPSSILLSLMASGFNGQCFRFAGYLPIDSTARKAALATMVQRATTMQETQIFIETPYRNDKLIEELCRTLPPRIRLCVATDLTTEHEEIATHTIQEWQKLQSSRSFHRRPTIFLLHP